MDFRYCRSTYCMYGCNVMFKFPLHYFPRFEVQPQISHSWISADPRLNVQAHNTAQDLMSRQHGERMKD